MSYEISLAKILSNRSPELHGRLSMIRKSAKPLLSYVHGKFPYYTPHDFSHSTNVEENLNWIIPDQLKEEMNSYEIFFLIVAAWLHDWGMVAENNEDPEVIREEHHIRTETNFERMHDKVNLSEHEARIVGRICKGHRKVDLNTRDYDDEVFGQNMKIRKRFLAALLRIADECDITHNRTPEVIYYSISPKGQSETEFKKHLSIAGIGQLEEKHKIYISAIARDPKGARTIKKVAQKIQSELDAVKAILLQNGVMLDLVELRLETRGFIDKPIGFEINKTRIVDLLIGDHLYGHQDVAIRELVQNSIDSCKLREILDPSSSCRIVLQRDGADAIVIEDSGLGMDYYEAKQFLSNIGSSFYNSELFQECLSDKSYSPISQYGIGILSCFLICNKITIETLKEGHEACKFSVEFVNEEWKYEKGSLRNPGTRITLKLNQDGRAIKLEDSLLRYFLCPEVPIDYRDLDGETKTFESAWATELVYQRFIRDPHRDHDGWLNEMLNLSMPDYDFIVGMCKGWQRGNLVLFNHGVYVGKFEIEGIGYPYRFCVNLKTNLVDLHISREDVKRNEKWSHFIYLLFCDVFSELKKHFQGSNKGKIISVVSDIIKFDSSFRANSEAELLKSYPFLRSFIDQAPFLIVSNKEVSVLDCLRALDGEELTIYNCCSESLSDELSVVSKLSNVTSLVVNPYILPIIRSKRGERDSRGLLEFLLSERGIRHTELDLRQMLISDATEMDNSYPELLPDNVSLVTFAHGLQPLVVVHEQPVVQNDEPYFGSAYWGNISLWKKLLDRERVASYLDAIRDSRNYRFEAIEIIDEHSVYVDSSDAFIRSVLDVRKGGEFDNQISEKVRRYFKYLSYLPLALNDLISCLIFLEVIDKLEAEIAGSLEVARPLPLFQRMRPDSKLFLEYFLKFGLAYIERGKGGE